MSEIRVQIFAAVVGLVATVLFLGYVAVYSVLWHYRKKKTKERLFKAQNTDAESKTDK